MAIPTPKEEFKEYCLRNLGKPVIEINVSDEVLEDLMNDDLIAALRDRNLVLQETRFIGFKDFSYRLVNANELFAHAGLDHLRAATFS